MKVARFVLAGVLLVLAMGGCGPSVPPAGNYATITGTVTDASNGQPVAGATVSVSVVSSQTDSSGKFTLYPIPTGPFTSISASAPNYQPYFNNSGGTLAPGQILTFNIQLNHS